MTYASTTTSNCFSSPAMPFLTPRSPHGRTNTSTTMSARSRRFRRLATQDRGLATPIATDGLRLFDPPAARQRRKHSARRRRLPMRAADWEPVSADAPVPSLCFRPQRLHGGLGAGHGTGDGPPGPQPADKMQSFVRRAARAGRAGRTFLSDLLRQPPKLAACRASGAGSTGRPTTREDRSSAKRSARTPGNVRSNSFLAPPPRQRPCSWRCVRRFGFTTS